MFSEKLVYSLFLRFLILKNENNIFETLLKSENLTLKFHNSYKNSSPSVKSEQQCSVTSSRQNFFLSMLLPKKSPDFFFSSENDTRISYTFRRFHTGSVGFVRMLQQPH